MEYLTPLATAFLDAEDEDPNASLAIGSITVFEGPPPSYEEFLEAIAGRLPLLPRYRQRLRPVPFDLGPPAWVDDPHFDVRWHIRNTALPSPGGPLELGRLMGRVMSRRMNRNRPLWEYWFVEGLEEGRWALISKIHHSMVDGVSGTDIYRLILDPTPEPTPAVADTWTPARAPTSAGMVARSMWRLATTPAVALETLAGSLRAPGAWVRRSAETAVGLVTLSRAARPADASSLVGPIGQSCRYTWTSTSMEDLRTIRDNLGGSVNDVALAAVTGGFRDLLLSRGETPSAHTLRSLVPVSTRARGAESVLDNRVSLMLPYLPVDVADPVEALAVVRERISAMRAGHEPKAGERLTGTAEHAPFAPVAYGIRLAFHLPQRQIVTVTTNVPGPQMRLYALGREVTQMMPFVPIADRVRIGVAMFSYHGAFTFGITGDYDTVPDIEVLARGIDRALEGLLEVARQPA